MPLDNERKYSYSELGDCQESVKEFTQQDIRRCLAILVLLVQRRRPLSMAIKDIEMARGKLLANAVRKEIEAAEKEVLFG